MLRLALLTALFGCAQNAWAEDEAVERADYIQNFAQYVRWPEAMPEARICTQRADALIMASVVEHGMQIEPRALARDLKNCRIYFLDAASASSENETFAHLRGRPVLTVGEGSAFLDRGGMVALVRYGPRLRMEVNVKAAEAAGLRFDPQLLELAARVVR